jgi:hypothetical protein
VHRLVVSTCSCVSCGGRERKVGANLPSDAEYCPVETPEEQVEDEFSWGEEALHDRWLSRWLPHGDWIFLAERITIWLSLNQARSSTGPFNGDYKKELNAYKANTDWRRWSPVEVKPGQPDTK